ncbi:unnamed protein product [Gongylonema pulchrum]|uniref:Rab-GAP TBC domain-containing protein n=1 Tax=Gongylonema pulchrum TaxID=637853 RepID=A0A183EYB2_9BILA|nr:unnamed protein product [Gongylonema pulchrum]
MQLSFLTLMSDNSLSLGYYRRIFLWDIIVGSKKKVVVNSTNYKECEEVAKLLPDEVRELRKRKLNVQVRDLADSDIRVKAQAFLNSLKQELMTRIPFSEFPFYSQTSLEIRACLWLKQRLDEAHRGTRVYGANSNTVSNVANLIVGI